MLNVKLNAKKGLGRVIGAIVTLSVLFTALPSFNASAQVSLKANKSFYENFEYDGSATYTSDYNNKIFNGWGVYNFGGSTATSELTSLSLSTTDTGLNGKDKALKVEYVKPHDNSKCSMIFYNNPDMKISEADIIIGADVYFPNVSQERESDSNKKVDDQFGFYVSRGLGTSKVLEQEGWVSEYVPATSPAFGLVCRYVRNEGWRPEIYAPMAAHNTWTYTGQDEDNDLYNYRFESGKWYNISYVYHPVTGKIDYYVDGVKVFEHPTGRHYDLNINKVNYKGNYVVPDLGVGKDLGRICLMTATYATNDKPGMFDNVSVSKNTSQNYVDYGEIENGSYTVSAHLDVPVKPETINATVKKLADNDVAFIGTGATTVASSQYTVNPSVNNVSIEFNQPLAGEYDRYRIELVGKDIYNKDINYVYNCVVKENEPVPVKKAEMSESFDTASDIWNDVYGGKHNKSWVESEDDRDGVFKIETTEQGGESLVWKGQDKDNLNNATYCNIPVNKEVDYIDFSFDIKGTKSDDKTFYYTALGLYNPMGSTSFGTAQIALGFRNGADPNEVVVRAYKNGGNNERYTGKPFTLNEWHSYKMRYYPWTADIEVYSGTTQDNMEKIYTCKHQDSSKNLHVWDPDVDGNRTFTMGLRSMRKDNTTYLDNIKVESYGYPTKTTSVKGITFENSKGDILDANNIAGAKIVKIHLENATDETVPALKIGSTEITDLNGTLDSDSGIYTMELQKMLMSETTYTLTVGENDYSFTTKDGVYEVSGLRFVDDNDQMISGVLTNGNVTAAVDVYNSTSDDKHGMLIWAAYSGSELKYVDIKDINAMGGTETTVKGSSLNVTDEYTEVKVFLWDGFTKLKPLLNDVSLKRAE